MKKIGSAMAVRWITFAKSFSILALAGIAFAQSANLDQVQKLYDRTQYDSALKLLLPDSADTAQHGVVQFWIGKNYFMKGEFRKSADFFQKAIDLESEKSEYFHWLGKAYGRLAETSNMFAAPGYATKARQNFEKAVLLDQKNLEAINDLFEYYLDAPGFLGGGLDKAAKLANMIGAVDPVEHHWALATIAERKKQFDTAEEHFRRAMEMAPKQMGRAIDLARFLSKQGKVQESDAVFALAEKINPNDPRYLWERANSYIRAKRNLDQAKLLLEKYMKAPLGPEDHRPEEARKLLKLASSGA
jgi:tetratricopeptide (TPR) repeat protein